MKNNSRIYSYLWPKKDEVTENEWSLHDEMVHDFAGDKN